MDPQATIHHGNSTTFVSTTLYAIIIFNSPNNAHLMPGSSCLQWTSSTTFPDGQIVEACVGDTVRLPWAYNVTSLDSNYIIDWIVKSQNQETTLLNFFRGEFTRGDNVTRLLQIIPNAGLTLPDVTLEDNGHYRIQIALLEKNMTYTQNAVVRIYEPPVMSEGALYAYSLPGSVYLPSTGQQHERLGCGRFMSLGWPPVSVVWNTPTNEQAEGIYINNTFIFTLSNPVQEGDYSCSLNRSSPAIMCLGNQSVMNPEATVQVTGLHTRLSLLEGNFEALRQETIVMSDSMHGFQKLAVKIENKSTAIENELYSFKNETENLFSVIQNAGERHERVASEIIGLQAENRNSSQVARNIQLQNELLTDEVIVLKTVMANITNTARNVQLQNELLTEEVIFLKTVMANITNIARDTETQNRQLKDEAIELRAKLANNTGMVHELQARNTKLEKEAVDLREVVANITDIVRGVRAQHEQLQNHIHQLQGEVNSRPQENCSVMAAVLDLQYDVEHLIQDQFGLRQFPSKNNQRRPASCDDVRRYDTRSGIHTIFLNNSKTLNVYCDQKTENGPWTVIQRRLDGTVDFFRDWEQYETGFGNLSTEFWIGLINLHHLTNTHKFKLRVDLTDFDGSSAYAVYRTFNISDAHDNYRLYVDGYSGTAGDSFANQNLKQFSTFDRDNDEITENCAHRYHGAWWYRGCHYSNLNGRYMQAGARSSEGLNWFHWKNDWRSFKRIEMKIREWS